MLNICSVLEVTELTFRFWEWSLKSPLGLMQPVLHAARGEPGLWVRIWVAEGLAGPPQSTVAPLGGIQLHCDRVTGTRLSCCCSRDANGSGSPLKPPFTLKNPLWARVAAGGLGQGLRCRGGRGTLGEGGEEFSEWKLAKLKKLLVSARAGNPSVSVTPAMSHQWPRTRQ